MPAGSLTLELLSTGGGTCNSNPYAVCLSNFKINIASSCNVTIEPLMATNSYVPGIWSSNSAGTYKRLVACPTWSREAVAPAGSGSPDQSQMKAAIKQAIEQHIYGSDYAQTLSSVTWEIIGKVYLQTTIPESCSLKYAITQVRGWWADEMPAYALPRRVLCWRGAAYCHRLWRLHAAVPMTAGNGRVQHVDRQRCHAGRLRRTAWAPGRRQRMCKFVDGMQPGQATSGPRLPGWLRLRAVLDR